VNNQSEHITTAVRAPWRNVMILFGLILLGLSAGNLLSVLAIFCINSLQSNVSIEALSHIVQNPEQVPHAWYYIMFMQTVVHVCTFLIPSLIYWRWIESQQLKQFLKKPSPSILLFLIAFLVVLVFMPFNSLIIELNQNMRFPANLKFIEDWMSSEENTLQRLSNFLTDFTTFPKFIVAIVVIAVIPAIGEECLFRGLIQRKIFSKTKDMHVAIWVSAALFSAIHLQFYGFVPRMLLGSVFGYLYWWSSNLWIPIFAHFVNNGSTLLLLFLNKRQVIQFDIENTESSVSVIGGLLSLVLTLGLLYFFKKNTGHLTISEKPTNNWVKVYETQFQHQVQIVHDYLSEKNILSVIISKKDSSYQWGRYELMVSTEEQEMVKNIIEHEISFK
jgi:uncharacterized protein